MELDNRFLGHFLSHGTYVLLLQLKKVSIVKKKGLCGAPHLDMLFLTEKKLKI